MNALDFVTNKGVFNAPSPQQKVKYDGYLDGLYADMAKSSEDINFINTLESVMSKNRADKIKMCSKIGVIYGKESLRNSKIFSREDLFWGLAKLVAIVQKILNTIKEFFNKIFKTVYTVVIRNMVRTITKLAGSTKENVCPRDMVTDELIKEVEARSEGCDDETTFVKSLSNLTKHAIEHINKQKGVLEYSTNNGYVMEKHTPITFNVISSVMKFASAHSSNLDYKALNMAQSTIMRNVLGSTHLPTKMYLQNLQIMSIDKFIVDMYKIVNIKFPPSIRALEKASNKMSIILSGGASVDDKLDPKDQARIESRASTLRLMVETVAFVKNLLMISCNSIINTMRLGISMRTKSNPAEYDIRPITVRFIPDQKFGEYLQALLSDLAKFENHAEHFFE